MEGASGLYCACEPEKEAPKRLGVAGIAAMAVVVIVVMAEMVLWYAVWQVCAVLSGYAVCAGNGRVCSRLAQSGMASRGGE